MHSDAMRVASKLGTLIFLCSSCANFGNSSHSSSVLPTIDELSSISLDFHDLEGNFDGTPFFTDVLRAADRNWFKRVIKSHNFPTATLHSSCKVLVTGGGVSVANLDARQKEVASKLKSPRVFLVVNAEDKSGEENYARMNDDIEKDDPVVILGTWFNSRTRNYRSLSRGLSSIYVPFGSINFAERHKHTPLDLANRSTYTRLHDRANVTCKNGLPAVSVAFQYGLRDMHRLNLNAEAEREGYWDSLNVHLNRTLKRTGVALSSSNGILNLGCAPSDALRTLFGEPVETHKKKKNQHSYNYDQSVHRYSCFQAVVAMEHRLGGGSLKSNVKESSPAPGYITEKIIDVLLAGSVPIYSGSDLIHEIFKPSAFVYINASKGRTMEAGEKNLAEIMRIFDHPDEFEQAAQLEGVLQDGAMEKFFSWHPAVWPHYGDELIQRILNELRQHCWMSIQNSASKNSNIVE